MFVHAYLICLEWVRKGNVLQLFAPQCQTKQRERQANKTAAAADTFGSVAAARFAATAAPLFFFCPFFRCASLYLPFSLPSLLLQIKSNPSEQPLVGGFVLLPPCRIRWARGKQTHSKKKEERYRKQQQQR
jgi:hypothetical protein